MITWASQEVSINDSQKICSKTKTTTTPPPRKQNKLLQDQQQKFRIALPSPCSLLNVCPFTWFFKPRFFLIHISFSLFSLDNAVFSWKHIPLLLSYFLSKYFLPLTIMHIIFWNYHFEWTFFMNSMHMQSSLVTCLSLSEEVHDILICFIWLSAL